VTLETELLLSATSDYIYSIITPFLSSRLRFVVEAFDVLKNTGKTQSKKLKKWNLFI
jgi:hypothetical protein